MSYKVYSGKFLACHGYPVIIVTSPIVTGDKHEAECHIFFSGIKESYSLTTGEYDSEDKDMIDDSMIEEAVRKDGEELLYKYLADENNIQYQAMRAVPQFSDS